MTIRLLIADDHEVVRAGIKSLVKGSDIEVVAEAASGEEAVAASRTCKPDVIVLDVRMARVDGLTALERIKLEQPKLPILMFSTFGNPDYVSRAVALGASGYVLKNEGAGRLLEAIHEAADGKIFWRREESRRQTGNSVKSLKMGESEVQLTRREDEVLRQMTLGLTNKEIAVELHISYETVKEHVQHILRKVGVNDRTQAAVWAVRNGLV